MKPLKCRGALLRQAVFVPSSILHSGTVHGRTALRVCCSIAVLLSLCAAAQPFTNTIIFLENQKPGTTSWLLTNPTPSSGGIEGYASATSVGRGEQINFLV